MWSEKRRKQPLLLDEGLQRIRVTGVAHVEAVLQGLCTETGRSRWHGVVRQERPLGGGTVTSDALSKRVPDTVGLSGSGL
jgi:hypothetical protein